MGLVLIVVGIALAVVGYVRFRGPWARYQELKAKDANIARYESWRGGLRDSSPTGASVAMELFRSRARIAGGIMVAGAVVAFVGLLVR